MRQSMQIPGPWLQQERCHRPPYERLCRNNHKHGGMQKSHWVRIVFSGSTRVGSYGQFNFFCFGAFFSFLSVLSPSFLLSSSLLSSSTNLRLGVQRLVWISGNGDFCSLLSAFSSSQPWPSPVPHQRQGNRVFRKEGRGLWGGWFDNFDKGEISNQPCESLGGRNTFPSRSHW